MRLFGEVREQRGGMRMEQVCRGSNLPEQPSDLWEPLQPQEGDR